MGLNLRLSLLRLRQKINFRLMRILLVFLYMAITASVLIYHFHSASEPLTRSGSWARKRLSASASMGGDGTQSAPTRRGRSALEFAGSRRRYLTKASPSMPWVAAIPNGPLASMTKPCA